jgi:uncharacterized protein
MVKFLIGFTIGFILIITYKVQAQHIDNIGFLWENITLKTDSVDKNRNKEISSSLISETAILGMGLIRGYQLFLSSQDRPSCAFTLSCSRFSSQAIRRRGVLVGILLTADRLTRCNDFARRYYQIEPITGLMIDPVPFYEFNRKSQ